MKFLRLPLILFTLLISTSVYSENIHDNSRLYDSTQTSELPEITSQNLGELIKTYVKKNWRFAIKRVVREMIHEKINEHHNPNENKFFDGASYTAVELTLDTVFPSDDEDWMMSIFLAGALKYYATKDITRAVAASALQYTRNYMMESFIAKKMGRDAAILNLVPFFTESLDDDKPNLKFNFNKGLENRIAYFLCWNNRTRIPSPFPEGSINDNAFMNFVSCAVLPSIIDSLKKNKMFPRMS